VQDLLKIALIQSDLAWENPKQNRAHFSKIINTISTPIDLVILPEMFTTGFSMNPESIAETMDGETIRWLKTIAKNKDIAIAGSIIIKEEGNYYNRLVFVYPSGKIKTYDKRHTFTLAGEDEVFTSGKERLIIDYKGWKLCPMICYDLRFPVWARNTDAYDVLIYVANWPKPRIAAWETLLKARAIENMSYVIGVNRIGKDANQYEYSGNSAAFDSLGNTISKIKPDTAQTKMISLSKNEMLETRNKFQFLNDKDAFEILNN